MDRPKPLGYWLHHLHNLLETHFTKALIEMGTNRREWQLLNTLAEGPRTRTDLERALAPFWGDDQPGLPQTLATLAGRGWTQERAGVLTLSQAGSAAHAEIAPRVDQIRAVVTKGLTPNQYQETIRVLTVMAGNVEAAIAQR